MNNYYRLLWFNLSFESTCTARRVCMRRVCVACLAFKSNYIFIAYCCSQLIFYLKVLSIDIDTNGIDSGKRNATTTLSSTNRSIIINYIHLYTNVHVCHRHPQRSLQFLAGADESPNVVSIRPTPQQHSSRSHLLGIRSIWSGDRRRYSNCQRSQCSAYWRVLSTLNRHCRTEYNRLLIF